VVQVVLYEVWPSRVYTFDSLFATAKHYVGINMTTMCSLQNRCSITSSFVKRLGNALIIDKFGFGLYYHSPFSL
jgi:hypothetical protein